MDLARCSLVALERARPFVPATAQEMRELTENPVPGCTAAFKGDSVLEWIVTMDGPASSPYSGGRFVLKVTVRRSLRPR